MTTDYRRLGEQLGSVCDEKNRQYGNSFAKSGAFLKLLYPNGLAPEQYDHALLLVRVFDKQMRIAQGALEDSFADIVGYGLLGERLYRESKPEAAKVLMDGEAVVSVTEEFKSRMERMLGRPTDGFAPMMDSFPDAEIPTRTRTHTRADNFLRNEDDSYSVTDSFLYNGEF